MSVIHLSGNSQTSITVRESFDLEKQKHYAGCVETLCPERLQRKHSCRLWHILLSLFVVAAIILVLAVLLATHTGDSGGKETKASNGRKSNKKHNNVGQKSG